jgi:hypothetical protein
MAIRIIGLGSDYNSYHQSHSMHTKLIIPNLKRHLGTSISHCITYYMFIGAKQLSISIYIYIYIIRAKELEMWYTRMKCYPFLFESLTIFHP